MVDKIDTPLDFYKNVVEVDIIEFRNAPDDLRLAYHACVSLLSLRDWVLDNYKNSAWSWQGAAQSTFAKTGELQAQLERLHDEFRIITDVANASKHLTLDIKRRRTQAHGVANVQIQSTTTFSGGAMLGNFGLNTTMLNQAAQAVTEDSVVIDDGGKLYDVKMSVESTNAIWLRLFSENNW